MDVTSAFDTKQSFNFVIGVPEAIILVTEERQLHYLKYGKRLQITVFYKLASFPISEFQR